MAITECAPSICLMRTLAFPAKSFSNDVVAAWPRARTSSPPKLIDSTSPVLGLRLCFGTSMPHGFPLAPLKLVRCPRSLAPTLVALPSMSLIPVAPFALSHSLSRRGDLTVHLARSHGSIDSFVPTKLICYHYRLDRPSRSFPRLDCRTPPSRPRPNGAGWNLLTNQGCCLAASSTSFSARAWRLRPVALSSEPRCWLSLVAVPCASDSLSEICRP